MKTYIWVTAALAAVSVTTGCSGADIAQCVTHAEAEVCAASQGPSTVVEASGLQPGSTLTVDDGAGTEMTFSVGNDGAPKGVVGLMSKAGSRQQVVTVTATSSTGSEFTAEVKAHNE